MSAREQLADYLSTALGGDYLVHAAVVGLPPIPAGKKAAIVVDAPTFEPASNALGALILTFVVHVVIDVADPLKAAERFDDVLPEVFGRLDAFDLIWTSAKPDQYDEQKPSYAITIQTTTAKG